MKKSIFKLISYAVIFLSLVFSVSAAALTIPEARTSPAGSEVTVNGYAFSATDTPSTGFINEFYLNDAKAQGICVVPSTGTSVTLLSGYSVTGTLSEENGELKIINATVTALNNNIDDRKIKKLNCDTANDYKSYGGTFVKIVGTATSPVTENGMLKSFTLTDKNGSVRVEIPTNVLSLSRGTQGKAELTEALQYKVTVNVVGFIARNNAETYIKIKDCDDIEVQVHNCTFGKEFVEKEPSCGVNGLSVMECECGRRQETVIPALEHSFYNSEEKTATCTEDGLKAKLCRNCNFREETVISKTGHNYKERVDSEATCETDGVKVKYCNNCDFTESFTIPKTGHNYKERTEREPSC
ncbi:MAG: hypothetical protein IIW88_10225, partial [Clostridia bacterium]|nr:hypothetical protein [Clostridia bacterium]